MDTHLDIEVRAALDARRGQWPQIAEACDVSHSWISQFVRGKIPNPGFKTLKTLREHLGPPPAQAADDTRDTSAGEPVRAEG